MAHPSAIFALALAIASAVVAPALAAEPVGATGFNVKAIIDLKALSEPTFVALVEPAAKAETAGPLVFYDFAWAAANRERILAEWEKRYGSKNAPKS